MNVREMAAVSPAAIQAELSKLLRQELLNLRRRRIETRLLANRAALRQEQLEKRHAKLKERAERTVQPRRRESVLRAAEIVWNGRSDWAIERGRLVAQLQEVELAIERVERQLASR